MYRAVVLPASRQLPYVIEHTFKSRVYILRWFQYPSLEQFDTRYWPLVLGFAIGKPRPGDAVNWVATALFDVMSYRRIYGDALLVGYDPYLRSFTTVTDEVFPAVRAAYEFSLTLPLTTM